VNDLYAVVTAMSECDDTEECEECIAFAVCTAACRVSTFDRQRLAAALLGVTS
jgi:radical SAM protein with 4Fe4S-binding SPASM domain